MLIAVDFIGGVSEREIFSKLREPGTKREPGYDTFCKIEIDEIVKILTVNSTSKKWEKVDSQNDLELKYQTADGNRFAVYREDSILHTIANRKTDETKSYREKDPTLEIYTKKWFQLIGTEIDKTRKKPTESPKTNSLANF